MIRFTEWVARRRLLESYYALDQAEYNRLFDDELDKLERRLRDPRHLAALERMRGFNWTGYIAQSLRRQGYREPSEVAEKTHDLITKLLSGALFRGLDEKTSGPIDARFRTAVNNAIVNLAKKERARRRYLPSIRLGRESEVGTIPAESLPAAPPPQGDPTLIGRFRDLVGQRLGDLGITILDARLAGQELKDLIGRPELGAPGRTRLRNLVRRIKSLAAEFARETGDEAFARDVQRAMEREGRTIAKRLAAQQ